jgi:hypothetical protein
MTPQEAYLKCENENRRISELESVIVNDPYYSYRYARDVIKGRWEEGEKVIISDLNSSYFYACDVVKGKWEEAEKIIATDLESSYWYARHVLKSTFELCHPIIFNSEYRDRYVNFLKSINYDLNKIGEWLI